MNLTERLHRRIATQGPITLADYMTACLLDPAEGYYTTRDPLGAAGDFITAPEVSQMFGELLGLALAQSWLDQGAPAPFLLAEPGPGRGTLMADILRATRAVPGFHDAARLCLIEASPALQAVQAATLRDHAPSWVDRMDDMPDLPLFLVANEFFDALPVRQFRRDGPAWREVMIALRDDALTFGLGPSAPVAALAHRLEDTAEGDVVEICAPAAAIAAEIGQRIETRGGVALIFDYGDWRSLGDTFQAMRGHGHADPLADPGKADLTAHVDFEALATSTPSAHSLLTPQGVVLERLGITARAQRLAEGLTGSARDAHIAAHRRLTHPAEMGSLFKALAFYPRRAAPPPGFEAAGNRP
ncbi:ATP synthase subunit beta [Oceanicola sp. 22II-s10i]|uniref:class I SAM-dependent methyltransferase n=1 Tax=Oceanicola sp. 22II-s10i TaxID=1317116 RepID=UPI000B51E724|nr:SAM-dependent methyltransferase [Oceanicola sp. 22II-s10i]OWU84275.1 ATP synthase subunit beta [Oceanicola sp. 22II-s10i]